MLNYTMEEYNLEQTEQALSGSSIQNTEIKPAKYFVGFLAGFGVSILLGGIVAAICCWMESVHSWIVAVATILIGITVQNVSNREGFISALISAICGAVAVIVFTFILEFQGYAWDDGTAISDNMLLYIGIAALVSGWAGWKDHSND